MFTPSRNPEWSNAARAFMLRTAASIVTASKFAPITRPTTSSGNGAAAAAHRAITFSSDRYSSGKCVWARISRILARARWQNRKTLRPPERQVLQPRPRRRAAHQRQAQLRLAQVQVLRQTPVRHPQVQRLPKQLHRLHQRVRLQRRQQRQVRVLQQTPVHHPQARHLPKQLHRLHQRALLQHRQHRLPLHRRQALRPLPVRMRLPLRQLRQRRRTQAQPRERRGLCRRAVNHRCIPLRGIMCIFIRRAVSTSIRTCRLIASFIKHAASMTRPRMTV